MKTTIGIAIAIILIASAVLLRYLGADKPQPLEQLAPNVQLYDVRTPEEYASGHVAHATLLPVSAIENGKLPSVPKDTPIALYCRSGHRAGIALDLLKKAGYANVQNIGGLNDLAKFGLSIQ